MRVCKLSSLVKRSETRSYLKKYTRANPMSKQSHSDFFLYQFYYTMAKA